MQPPMQNPAEIMKVYFECIKAFLNQSKSITVSLTPKPDVLRISETISALPQTKLAELFTEESATKTDNKMLCYLKDGSMFNMAGKISGKYNKLGMDFFVKMFGKDITEEQKTRINNYLTNYANVFSGSFAGSFTITPKNQPIFAGEMIYEVKDKTRFDEVMKEGATFLEYSGMADFYKEMGIVMSSVYSPDVDSYKGFSISSAKFAFKSTDPNAPQAQMIEKMYGEGLETRWALVDDLCVYTMGANADSQIKKLIDEVTAPGSKEICSEIKAATALLPGSENADLFMTFNLLRVFKAIPEMTGIMPAPVPMPAMDFETTSNVVIAANIGESKLTVDVAIPKQHLMEIMQAVQLIMINQANISATKATLKTLHNAVIEFKMDTGRFPTEAEGLIALIEQPVDVENYQTGGYIGSTQLPKDPWGNDFIYELNPESGEPFLIRSCGPDGQPETEDDLLSTNSNGC
jgi:general secretion pathway protein G